MPSTEQIAIAAVVTLASAIMLVTMEAPKIEEQAHVSGPATSSTTDQHARVIESVSEETQVEQGHTAADGQVQTEEAEEQPYVEDPRRKERREAYEEAALHNLFAC